MKTTDYTRGTLRPTEWDMAYMNKPTDLSDKYPDCFGSLERIENDKLEKRIRWVSRLITVIIAVSAAMALLHFLERFQ